MAASQLFRRRGVHGTGMRDIAAALGMTAGNLYHYFPSKQHLLAFCQAATLDALERLAESLAFSGDRTVTDRLEELLAGHVVVLNETIPGSLAHLEDADLPAEVVDQLAARRRRYEERIRDLVHQGVESGELRRIDSGLATRTLLGGVNWSVRWFEPAGPKPAAEVGREIARLLVGGLRRTE